MTLARIKHGCLFFKLSIKMVVPNYYLITEYVASIESVFLPLDNALYPSAQRRYFCHPSAGALVYYSSC